MGYYIKGILGYGFRVPIGEDDDGYNPEWLRLPGEEGETMQFDDFLAKVVGLEEPGDYNEKKYNSDPAYAQTWQDYWASKGGLADKLGVTLEMHGDSEEPIWMLMAKDSLIDCDWSDEPLALGQNIPLKPEWREALFAFCERAGIKFIEPQFILCCYRV